MKKKKNKIILWCIIAIIVMFIITLFVPALQIAAKIGALLIYTYASYTQIMGMKKHGDKIEKAIMFSAAVIIIFGYLLLFT